MYFYSWDSANEIFTYNGARIIPPGESYTVWNASARRLDWNNNTKNWEKTFTANYIGKATFNTTGIIQIDGSVSLTDVEIIDLLKERYGECIPPGFNLGDGNADNNLCR